jgi:quercetin dioxygenase-like cupin family protein
MTFLAVGDKEPGPKHLHDHLTLLTQGGLRVIIEDQETVFQAPSMIYINRDKEHTFIALEDMTVAYAIHALRNKDSGDILDPAMFPNGVTDSDVEQLVS